MLFYNPKRKISLFDHQGISAKRISDYKRYNHGTTYSLSIFLLSIFLLLFSVRIGSILFLYLTNYGETELIFAIQNIELPYANSSEKFNNKRLISYVSVKKDGKYKVSGQYISLDELEKHLSSASNNLPNVVIGIVADKNCEMQHINELILVIRKSNCRRVLFYTDKDHSSY